MRSVNRRDIFPALGTVLLGGIATASLAKPESLSAKAVRKETAISKAFRAYHEAYSAMDRIADLSPVKLGSPEDKAREAFLLRESDKLQNALEVLAETRATCHEDLRLKSLIVLKDFPEAVDAFELLPDSVEIRLVLSVAHDAAHLTHIS
ncbi:MULTISPECIES: hypothetical protein [Gluconobacter]|uniref:hypothetical protein n=1 Tax=Gluconobacter TaxID=441 RepID=UPI0039E8FA70